MKRKLVVAALMLLPAVPLFGQAVVSCSSDDMQRHYCETDTRGGVRLVRQHSDSECRQGYSWGYDRRGIWVDHGCRADFAFGGGAGERFDRDHGSDRGDAALYCSSDDMRRHYCEIDTRGGVRLVRQRSDSECRQGYSWGYDRRGIWVDHGCRADFVAGGGERENADRDRNKDRGDAALYCASDDMRRHYCEIDARGGARLVRQRSDSECREGYSWGYDRRGIWVDHGCRADFVVRR
jgi:hypothetical protein